MKLITTLTHFSTIQLGDEITHPVFGKMRVDAICKINDLDCEIACSLKEFNDTLKVFDGMDLIRIKYRRRTRLKVIK